MHSITVVSHVDASPDDVWNVIGNPSTIDSWHPIIAKSTVNGSDRHCSLIDGAKIHERIESIREDERAYDYSIMESPLPLSAYRSTIKVEEEGEGAAVVWSADFEPEGATAEEVAATLTGVYQAGLTALRGSF